MKKLMFMMMALMMCISSFGQVSVPYNFSSSQITYNTARIDWQCQYQSECWPGGFDLRVGIEGFIYLDVSNNATPIWIQTSNGISSFYSLLDSLEPGITYDVYIRKHCNSTSGWPGQVSEWAGPFQFITLLFVNIHEYSYISKEEIVRVYDITGREIIDYASYKGLCIVVKNTNSGVVKQKTIKTF